MALSTHKTESSDSDLAGHVEFASTGHTNDVADLNALGYKPELQRNRSMFTLLFQSLAVAAVSHLLPVYPGRLRPKSSLHWLF